MFERLQEHNLKLKPSKCELFREQVLYLGHVVSMDGIHTDPSKIEAVKNRPKPQNSKDVRKLLGFTGYYRRFVKGYAAIARPLTDLLVAHSTKPKGRNKKTVDMTTFTWGPEQQTSFVSHLTSPPVLAYTDYSKPFTFHTDAS